MTRLGLTIAQQLVNMLEGEICVDSTLGQGTTYFFTLCFGYPQALVSQPIPYTDGPIISQPALEGRTPE